MYAMTIIQFRLSAVRLLNVAGDELGHFDD